MSRRFIFMISLILVLGCANEKQLLVFEGNEALEHQKIIEDYNAPQYKWGYLNEAGQLSIADKYDDLREFNEGFAAYCKGGLWGYIDSKGNEKIPARYRTVKTYSEGIGVVQDLNGHFHLLHSNGNTIADSLRYDDISKFQEGKSVVNRGYLYGFIDKSAKVVIEPTYHSARSFVDGLAMVQIDNSFGFIDHDNHTIIPIQYDKIWYPKEEMIRFKKNGKYGYIDLSSKKEVYSGFASASNYQNDFAVVNDGNNYLLINKKGNKKPLPYNYVETGGEGKWIYSADDRFGVLDNNGEVLCLPQYDLLMRYRDGRAGFALDDAWGYLDETGSIIIPAQYPLVWDFVNGYARIIGQYGFGFINKNGTEFLPPLYMEVRDFSEGQARIQVYR
jgi:hypothetical protein